MSACGLDQIIDNTIDSVVRRSSFLACLARHIYAQC
jgi:hypothetical protein